MLVVSTRLSRGPVFALAPFMPNQNLVVQDAAGAKIGDLEFGAV
jgi:hypothetical protein